MEQRSRIFKGNQTNTARYVVEFTSCKSGMIFSYNQSLTDNFVPQGYLSRPADL
jgi:hypothetical protein